VEGAITVLSEGGGPPAAPPAAPVEVTDPNAVSAAAASAMRAVSSSDVTPLCEALASVPGGGGSLTLLRKLVGNVRDAPTDPKYRKVRLTNPKIAAALAGRVPAYALLAACGFVLDETGEHALIGEAAAADGAALEWACVSLDNAVTMAANGGPPVPTGPFDEKVLVAPAGQPMRFDAVADDFYALTGAEAKAMMEANAARRAKEERFVTREQREAEKAKQKRLYRKAMVRVRFPDDVVLQATFSATATVSAVLQWVEGALREPGHPFELSIARGQPLQEMGMSLEHAELAPASMLNFRCTSPGGLSPPYLRDALMARLQVMGEESIPTAVNQGTDAHGPMGATDPVGGGRAVRGSGEGPRGPPAWMCAQ